MQQSFCLHIYESFALFPQNSAVQKVVSYDRTLADWHIPFDQSCHQYLLQLRYIYIITNKSTLLLMRLIKTVMDAPGLTHSCSQLRTYVICKTDSEDPKNKLEFHFFKPRLIWVSVFCIGYKVQFSLLLSRKIVQVIIKYLNQKKGILVILNKKKKKKKKEKAKNRAGCLIRLFQSGPAQFAWQSLQGLETECLFKQFMRRLVYIIISFQRSKLVFCVSGVYLFVNPMQIDTLTITVPTCKKQVPYRKCEKGRSRLVYASAQSYKGQFYLLCRLTRPDILYIQY